MRTFNLLGYDPATGKFWWLASGKPAGTIDGHGYRVIQIDGVNFQASNIAWVKMTGEFPDKMVDHRNRIRDDDRWENLRLATRSQNTANSCVKSNSQTGVKGVRMHKHSGRYNAYIKRGGKQCSLGYFKTVEEASAAFRKAHAELYKEFSPYHTAALRP